MPSINRIRVNNVKYNFGTQSYDDFTMRMYGRNTLYDLANGGGKSVLMLLLMQCLIPNCTLDDKQPIEKLFRDQSNTVIHSLVEWKLDECDIKDGYRYMTTGFAAKKATFSEDERPDGTAEIQYFNYCIFYRNYNKNDIINLPLDKEKEHISYKALRNYLHDLSRNDKNLQVYIFDRKGEYQRFIAQYGLYESHWEIIRGINKTEGHVRTYFESNYKTTRRVIEDLLIEEIIEKAYLAKTKRDTDKTETTVSLLMTIQEELKALAEKKKDIQVYDHEKDLLQLLIDRIESFMELYTKQEDAVKDMASIYHTVLKEKENQSEKLGVLKENVAAAEKLLEDAKRLVAELKIYADIRELKLREQSMEECISQLGSMEQDIEKQDKEYKFRLALNAYQEIRNCREELSRLNHEKEAAINKDADIYTVVANIEDRMQKSLTELEEKISLASAEKEEEAERCLLHSKEISEAETEIAVTDSRLEYLRNSIKEFETAMTEKQSELINPKIGSPVDSIAELQTLTGECENKLRELGTKISNSEKHKAELVQRNDKVSSDLRLMEEKEKELIQRVEEYRRVKEKYKAIRKIYSDKASADADEILENISEKIASGVVNIYNLKQEIESLQKYLKDIERGRLVQPTEAVEKVRDYLATRHGVDAMFGMDYVAVLPDDMKDTILEKLPSLPYGLIVENLPKLIDDPGIKEIDTDQEVMLIDRNEIRNAFVAAGSGVEFIRRDKKYFMNPESILRKADSTRLTLTNLKEELRSKESSLTTFKEDRDFVQNMVSRSLSTCEQDLEQLRIEMRQLHRSREENDHIIEETEKNLSGLSEEKMLLEKKIENSVTDIAVLNEMAALQDKLSGLYSDKEELKKNRRRLEQQKEISGNNLKEREIRLAEKNAKLEKYVKTRDEQKNRWDSRYSAYYIDDRAFPAIKGSLEELEKEFEILAGKNSENVLSIEKEKLLRDTLNSNIERARKRILELSVDINELEKTQSGSDEIIVSEEILDKMSHALSELRKRKDSIENSIRGLSTEKARLEGSTEYAKQRLREEYGEEAIDQLREMDFDDVKIRETKAKEEMSLMASKLAKARNELADYEGQSKSYDDLLQVMSRIIDKNEEVAAQSQELCDSSKIRENFDKVLTIWDKLSKDVERAKADMLKVKMKVYDSLNEMNVMELAASIRDDVIIPDTKRQAEELLEKLHEVTKIILLERDRIEKSLVSMQKLRDNFVDQCVERCLDVRSELDKLTKLSEISIDDTKVEMIKLSIPYVRDEYIKDRMSEYIDKVVEEVEQKSTESDRQKFLSSSLAMKKLFSVIVTDMSKIKLLLYKRERIREQSRYLRFEEAVGSTGQSQGIYIQFLISIINYIAGMYATSEGGSRAKTLFIDNPFGAAKDIYIWEPIFKLLEENQCQLIVPARGATPEITGRFDINYVLGQQMTGNRTTTVVVNFSSKTKGEELEYKDLDYEQQTFDFI